MKKTIFQGIVFSTFIHLLIFGFQLLQGYIAAKFTSPDTESTSENIHVLQNEVVFSFYYHSGGILQLILSFLVAMGCFMVGKYVFKKIFKKS